MRRRRLLASALVVAGSSAVAWACLKPTQITLRLTTDVACSDLRSTSVYNGTATGADAIPFTTTTDCTDGPSRTIGTLVLAPSGDKSDTVTVTVVAGVKARSECTAANDFQDCIVARRRVRYVEHEPLELPVFLANSCRGIRCPDDQTCVPCAKEPCAANAAPLCAPFASVDVCDQPGANCSPAPPPSGDGGGVADVPSPPVAPREDAAGAIDAALPDGGAIVFRRLVSSPEQVYGLAFADGNLYWTLQGSLWRANLASLLSNADAGAQVAAPNAFKFRGVHVSAGTVGLALESPSPCAIAFPIGSADASVSVNCGDAGLGKGLGFIADGSAEGLVSTTGGVIHWLADGGRSALAQCVTSYLRVIHGPAPLASGLSGKVMVRGVSEVELAAFGDLVPDDVSTPGICALKVPGPNGQGLVSLAVTPRDDEYVTTKSGVVFKRTSTGPWTPFGGVPLTGAEDILVVPSANGPELQILVAAGDGVYIAENVQDRPI